MIIWGVTALGHDGAISVIKNNKIVNQMTIPFARVCMAFKSKILSSLRGSVIGFFCGLVPGVTTVLATNASYSLEKKLHKNMDMI